MCSGIFGGPPPAVNERGDTLSMHDLSVLEGGGVNSSIIKGVLSDQLKPGEDFLKLTPQQRGEMLFNWLTGGGPAKPVEPGKIFKEQADLAPATSKAAAGSGMAGLFGAGLLVGDLVPKTESLTPINQSPMQPGVPYSATPLVKMGDK